MADSNTATMETLQAEVQTLRSQLEKIIKSAEKNVHETGGDLAQRIAREIEHYRRSAMDQAGHIRDLGQAQLDDVVEQVRKNPLTSVAIAFGVGVVVAALLRQLR